MKIELHIFTNCWITAPDTEIVRACRRSFIHTFGDIKQTLWCDSHGPKERFFIHYKKNLQKYFPVVNKTRSLSDGYIRAIQESQSDWLFMLEGDWIFVDELITQSLQEIIQMMSDEDIYHLRFNKRKNIVKAWDKHLNNRTYISKDGLQIEYCETPILSNNPHIINRKVYLDFIKKGYIKNLPGSKGIEEIISKQPDTFGCIYGKKNHPATVRHLDGRRTRR